MKKKSELRKRIDDPNSSYWLKKADGAFVDYQRMIWGNECAVCKSLGRKADGCDRLEVHHLISRSVRSVRHDPNNGILLGSYHHKFSVACSPHAAPIGFSDWMRLHKPELYDWVVNNKWKYGKFNYKLAYENLQMLISGGV